jgi:predicted nucleotidyltransferase
MNRVQALQVLQSIRGGLEARGVQHVALFGSVARDQGNAFSDIDVLIIPHHGRVLNLFDLGAIQTMLEDAFYGRKVDVVVAPVRRDDMRQAISRDQVHAF